MWLMAERCTSRKRRWDWTHGYGRHFYEHMGLTGEGKVNKNWKSAAIGAVGAEKLGRRCEVNTSDLFKNQTINKNRNKKLTTSEVLLEFG